MIDIRYVLYLKSTLGASIITNILGAELPSQVEQCTSNRHIYMYTMMVDGWMDGWGWNGIIHPPPSYGGLWWVAEREREE